MSRADSFSLIEDILESGNKIKRYTHGMDFESFLSDDKTTDAVIRNFEIIGEAANRLNDEFKDRFPQVDWHRIRGFRNRIVHDYGGIDYSIVWNIIESFLPQLMDDLKEILHQKP
jgi:uncharacterized protein with HEPN domain